MSDVFFEHFGKEPPNDNGEWVIVLLVLTAIVLFACGIHSHH